MPNGLILHWNFLTSVLTTHTVNKGTHVITERKNFPTQTIHRYLTDQRCRVAGCSGQRWGGISGDLRHFKQSRTCRTWTSDTGRTADIVDQWAWKCRWQLTVRNQKLNISAETFLNDLPTRHQPVSFNTSSLEQQLTSDLSKSINPVTETELKLVVVLDVSSSRGPWRWYVSE